MSLKRYELIIQNPKTDQTLQIGFFDEEKGTYFPKATLSTIDLYTINFENVNNFLQTLSYNKEISNILNTNNYQVFIKYRNQRKIKTLKPAFQNCAILNDYASPNNTYVENKKIDYFMNLYKNFIANGVLYRYLKENQLINEYLLTNIQEFIYSKSIGTEDPYYLNRIKMELIKYKNIRDLIVGIIECEQKYDKVFLKKSRNQQSTLLNDSINIETDNSFLNEVLAKGNYEAVFNYHSLEELEANGTINYATISEKSKHLISANKESIIIIPTNEVKKSSKTKQKILEKV